MKLKNRFAGLEFGIYSHLHIYLFAKKCKRPFRIIAGVLLIRCSTLRLQVTTPSNFRRKILRQQRRVFRSQQRDVS